MLRHVGYQDLLIKLHNFDKFHAISGPDRAIFDKKKCHSGSHQIIWKSKEIQHESGWPVHHQSDWQFLQRAKHNLLEQSYFYILIVFIVSD